MEKIQIAEDQFIDVHSTRLSMKCRACGDRVEYQGKEAWKDHYYCPYCGVEYK